MLVSSAYNPLAKDLARKSPVPLPLAVVDFSKRMVDARAIAPLCLVEQEQTSENNDRLLIWSTHQNHSRPRLWPRTRSQVFECSRHLLEQYICGIHLWQWNMIRCWCQLYLSYCSSHPRRRLFLKRRVTSGADAPSTIAASALWLPLAPIWTGVSCEEESISQNYSLYLDAGAVQYARWSSDENGAEHP